MPTISPPERLPKSTVRVTVTFAQEEVHAAEEHVLARLGQNMKMDGFRPGKAPVAAVRERVDPDKLFEETVRELLKSVLPTVINEHEIRPILPPSVAAQSREPLTLTLTFLERPSVSWPKKGLPKIDRKETAIEAKAIDDVLLRLLRRYERVEPVQRPAAKGDRVTIDFSGKDLAGQELPGTKAQGVDLTIGSNMFIPGFEEHLIGKSAGQTHDFTVTFPAEYHAEHLRNKPVQFSVHVHAIAEVALPELTDAFAKEHLQTESAALVRERIEQAMKEEREMQETMRRERALLDAIADAIIVDLADELIMDEARAILEEHEHRLKEQNATLQQWMEHTKKTPESLEEELRKEGQRRLKTRFGLSDLVESKNVALTSEELKKALDEYATQLSSDEAHRMDELRNPDTDAHRAFVWQRRVEKLLEELLKD